MIAPGEYAEPNKYQIKTATAENPHYNLYLMAQDEFEDISYMALAMICETHEPICYELAEKASTPRYERIILHLGNVMTEVGCAPLEQALFEVLGSQWKRHYEVAIKLHSELC